MLQNQIDVIIEKDKTFAIGFRSDGEILYYRDKDRTDYKVFFDDILQRYYYVNNEGKQSIFK